MYHLAEKHFFAQMVSRSFILHDLSEAHYLAVYFKCIKTFEAFELLCKFQRLIFARFEFKLTACLAWSFSCRIYLMWCQSKGVRDGNSGQFKVLLERNYLLNELQ